MNSINTVLLLAVFMGSLTFSQSTCATGRVSLLPLSTTSFTVGSSYYTFGFCSAVHTSLTTMTQCSVAGYVQAHNTANTACLASYSSIVTGLTQTSTGAYFEVQDTAATQRANVSITCDVTATSGTVNLRTPISTVTASGVTTTTFDLTSLSGCSIDEFFCSDTVSCADSTKTCLQGVCFDKTCATVATVLQETKSPSNFISEVSVQDCHGTPLSNLSVSDFTVTLDGYDLTDTNLLDEVVRVIEPAPEEPVPSFTTLLLDQSSSVLANGQSVLKEAAETFVNIVTESSSNHYIAIIAFDGSAETFTVQDYTNDMTLLLTAIATGLDEAVLADPTSTDLYSAVINGLDEAYRMTFSFGNTSVPVTSSMIIFTDGHDTAGRTTSAAAIAKAAEMASKVRIMSVGISNTSDTSFLTSIATSGFFEFVSLSNLVQSFSDAANKLVALTSNNYYVLMCVPMRKPGIAVTIALLGDTFPSTNTLTFTIDGSDFTGGCNEEDLRTEIKTASLIASAAVDQLVEGSSLQKEVPTGGAFFFYFSLSSEVTVTVIPSSLTVLYVKSQRCILSDSCNDGNFTGGFALSSEDLSTRYDAMVQNSLGVATTVYVGTTATTPAPTPIVTDAQGVAVPTVINWSATSIDEGTPDLDEAGAIVLVVFVALFLVAFLVGAFYVRSAQTKSIEASTKKRRKIDGHSRLSDGHRSGMSGGSGMGGSGMSRGQPLLDAPVYSEIQPYRLSEQTRSLDNGENSVGLLNDNNYSRHHTPGTTNINTSKSHSDYRQRMNYQNHSGMDASPAAYNTPRSVAPLTRAHDQQVYLPPQVGVSPSGAPSTRVQNNSYSLGEGQSFDSHGRSVNYY